MNHAKPLLNTDSSYYLNRIEVFNWGGFSGFHRAEIHAQGTAIIGQTGSGKTTLIDALVTLLATRPSYNLASTGGHESDRDLISYIRGVSGAGEDDVARTGKTVTAMTAYFEPITSPQPTNQMSLFDEMDLLESDSSSTQSSGVALGVIFWIDSTSNQAKDRHDLWIFSQDNSELKDWLSIFEQDGKRGLKVWAKDKPNYFLYESKSSYLAKVQQFFDVGDNAFRLLNRTVGLKQLNSIDDIFRELVLEDESLFENAVASIAQFDTLTDIRHTLETAKKQQKALLPLETLNQKWQQAQQSIQQVEQHIQYLPYWYAYYAQDLWQQRIVQAQQEQTHWQEQEQAVQQQYETLYQQYQFFKNQYEQQGGARLISLEKDIEYQTKENIRLKKEWTNYQRVSEKLALPLVSSATELREQKHIAQQQYAQLKQECEQVQEQLLDVLANKNQVSSQIQEIHAQLQQALKQKSNIPTEFEQFRQALANHLGCAYDELPYVAELVAVKESEKAWQGAIERALGSHRLRLLVPARYIAQALLWVNARHNQLHVRLLDAGSVSESRQGFTDGFVHKLDIKEHELSSALMAVLADLDRHCVASVSDLERTAHAMTQQGMMSNKTGWFDKQDQRRLNDGWLTGFDNRYLLNQLETQLHQYQNQLHDIEHENKTVQNALNELQAKSRLYEIWEQVEFEQINWLGGQQKLADLERDYQQLIAPESELSQLKQRYVQLEQACHQCQHEMREYQKQHHNAEFNERNYAKAQNQAAQKLARLPENALSFTQTAIFQCLNQTYTPPTLAELDKINELERECLGELHTQQRSLEKDKTHTETQIVRQMGLAKQADTGELAEVGTELMDLPDYLQRLNFLSMEDLPSKEKKFNDYLTQSSTESVLQLMNGVKTQVEHIKERIAALNRVLQSVDFDKDKYLQLNTTAVIHPSIKEFEQAYKNVTTAGVDTIRNPNPEKHYWALRELIALLQTAVDKPDRLASKALLDARHRLSFSISVISRSTGQTLETRTGSQRGSGGEKEIIASYILTASLNYALSPSGMAQPKFATIVLDEAFSKSSQTVAGRIVKAIHAFGLHPLFVTPNKEMRLLREHTQSAVLVHRKDKWATLSNWSWEKIDAEARKHLDLK